MPFHSIEGALVLGTNIFGVVAGRSEDNGATWVDTEFAPGSGEEGSGMTSTNFLIIPPSSELPSGRIVVSGFGGIAYSDDDGRSWYPSNLFGDGAFAAWSSVRLTGGDHDGLLLAVVEGEGGFFYTSIDGEVWSPVSDVPTANRNGTRLTPVPDGGVYAYDTIPEGAPVWYSDDGGFSWEDVGPVWTDWPATTEEIVLGPDGRLYAACSGTFAGFDGGVFRTVDPVIVVANEPPPEIPENESGLRAYPNPPQETLTIETSGAGYSVFDVQGRLMVSGSSGSSVIDVSGWAAGVYIVQSGHESRLVTIRN